MNLNFVKYISVARDQLLCLCQYICIIILLKVSDYYNLKRSDVVIYNYNMIYRF